MKTIGLVAVASIAFSLTACGSTTQPQVALLRTAQPPASAIQSASSPPTEPLAVPTLAPSPVASATAVTKPQPKAAPSAAAPVTERVKVGDITMYYAAYGAGEPLLLLHGGMGSANDFDSQVPEFWQHYRVITPDNRGQGRTTDSDAPWSYRVMSEDTVGLMDYLKIDSAYIVGWSDGAIIGLDLAIRHPERVRALVAYGANTSPDGAKPENVAYWRNAKTEDLQAGFGGTYLRLSATPDHLPVIMEKMRTLYLTEPNFTAAELATIKTPTLVLDGERDEYILLDHVKQFAQEIPGAQLILIPGVGHFAPVQKPTEFNRIVLDLLKDN